MINEKTIKRLKQLNRADFVNTEVKRWTDKQMLDIVKHYTVRFGNGKRSKTN